MERIKNNEGFTLLEVIFSVSILTVGILAVATMQLTAIQGNASAWSTSGASSVAMSQIEYLRNLNYISDPNLSTGSAHSSSVTVGKINYSITWTVTADTVIPQTKSIDLIVQWKDHGNRKLNMTYLLGQTI
jgi:type IV pilus assembly protein PilV